MPFSPMGTSSLSTSPSCPKIFFSTPTSLGRLTESTFGMQSTMMQSGNVESNGSWKSYNALRKLQQIAQEKAQAVNRTSSNSSSPSSIKGRRSAMSSGSSNFSLFLDMVLCASHDDQNFEVGENESSFEIDETLPFLSILLVL